MTNPIIDARMFKSVVKPRLTFQYNFYHQLMGEDAKQYPFNGDTFLEVEETPYERSITVESEWMKLDFGWITPASLGMIILCNVTGGKRPVKPTKEEKEEDESAVLVLTPFEKICVPPKTPPCVIYPTADFTGMSVRSLGGPIRLKYVGIGR